MNKSNSFIALTLASLFVAQGVNASDGTISFVGKVTDTTCDVSVNGGGADNTVTLPTVSSSVLGAIANTAGRTNFSMALTNCSATSDKVYSYFESGANVDPATGRLTNSATISPATNVDLQLIDSDGEVIKAGDSSQQIDTVQVALVDDGSGVTGSATLNYAVEYFATGPATAGEVQSSVTYSISYN